MRRALALLSLAVLLALAPGAAAQPPSFTEPYQVRAAVGDIPTTAAAEPAGSWNVEQRLTVQFDNASAAQDRTYHFAIPAGATLANATCDCVRSSHAVNAAAVAFTIEPQTPSGQRTITVLTRQAAGPAFGFALRAALEAPPERALVLYVPGGSDIDSNVELSSPGASTDGSATIHYARFGSGDPMPDEVWAAIHPATTVAGGDGDDGDDGLQEWLLPAALGLVLGAALWAVLVSRGAVQKRSRKQVAATAAHVEAAATDPPAVLEGKKRALLAALKEVELARQSNEMPVEVYDAVKADLKKQAVTVMRALEEGGEDAKS